MQCLTLRDLVIHFTFCILIHYNNNKKCKRDRVIYNTANRIQKPL